MIQRNNHMKNMILCGFFACLTAVFSQIVIPIQPIPFNLATLSVMLAGGLLGPKWGAASQLVYMLMGLMGLPVFAEMTAGVAIVVGPSGGYIVGYIFSAWTVGFLKNALPDSGSGNGPRNWRLYLPYLAALPACYLPGTLWFMYVMRVGPVTALLWCVVPFLITDLLKATCAGALIRRLEAALKYV